MTGEDAKFAVVMLLVILLLVLMAHFGHDYEPDGWRFGQW